MPLNVMEKKSTLGITKKNTTVAQALGERQCMATTMKNMISWMLKWTLPGGLIGSAVEAGKGKLELKTSNENLCRTKKIGGSCTTS
jgi:hypothetical protein